MSKMNGTNGTHRNGSTKASNGFAAVQRKLYPVVRQSYMLPLDILSPASYNPPERSDFENKHVLRLAKSMKAHGQLVPIHVKPTNAKHTAFEIIEGHQRAAALLLNGEKGIESFIVERDAVEVYREIGVLKQHSPTQLLGEYLKDPGTVKDPLHTKISNMIKVVGRKLTIEVATKGFSYATYQQAQKIAYYCDVLHDGAFVKRSLRWLIRYRQTFVARKAMEEGIPHCTLKHAIEYNQPLR